MVHVMFTDSPTAPITGSGVTFRYCPLTETKSFLKGILVASRENQYLSNTCSFLGKPTHNQIHQ